MKDPASTASANTRSIRPLAFATPIVSARRAISTGSSASSDGVLSVVTPRLSPQRRARQ
jgi:hypothetical protein